MADNRIARMEGNISDAFEKALYEGFEKGVMKLRDSGTLSRAMGEAMRGTMFSGISGGTRSGRVLPATISKNGIRLSGAITTGGIHEEH